jgi:hypothetical protein
MPLYPKPEVITKDLTTADILNAYSYNPKTQAVNVPWPKGSSINHTGTSVTVVCQVENKAAAVTNADGQSSDIYDVIRVPAEHLNQQAIKEAENGSAIFGSQKNEQGKIEYAYAYSPALWLGGFIKNLSTCTSLENPGGYPSP